MMFCLLFGSRTPKKRVVELFAFPVLFCGFDPGLSLSARLLGLMSVTEGSTFNSLCPVILGDFF